MEGQTGLSFASSAPIPTHAGLSFPRRARLEKLLHARQELCSGAKSGNELGAKVPQGGRKPVCRHKGVDRKEREQTADASCPPFPASPPNTPCQAPPVCPKISGSGGEGKRGAETHAGHPLMLPVQWNLVTGSHSHCSPCSHSWGRRGLPSQPVQLAPLPNFFWRG